MVQICRTLSVIVLGGLADTTRKCNCVDNNAIRFCVFTNILKAFIEITIIHIVISPPAISAVSIITSDIIITIGHHNDGFVPLRIIIFSSLFKRRIRRNQTVSPHHAVIAKCITFCRHGIYRCCKSGLITGDRCHRLRTSIGIEPCHLFFITLLDPSTTATHPFTIGLLRICIFITSIHHIPRTIIIRYIIVIVIRQHTARPITLTIGRGVICLTTRVVYK